MSTLETYLVVAIAVERYLAVCRPLVYRGLELRAGGCVPRLLLYLGPALLLSILANTPRLLEMRLVTIVDTDSGNQSPVTSQPPPHCAQAPWC